MRAERILRISRVVADLARAERFYSVALGFSTVSRGPADVAVLDAGDADEVVMRLGAQEVAFVRFALPGRAAPTDSRSDDRWFQHLAIVVSDMDAAYAHLRSHDGWTPISESGPQTLPARNGGVRAFKFRDPDAHPLELIWFPPGQGRAVWRDARAESAFLGIDHSALSVACRVVSLRFYGDLGFIVSARSLNQGPAQSRLDAAPDARLRVVSLRPEASESAGLELLRYSPPGRAMRATAADLVTDWVTVAVSDDAPLTPSATRDPDGHRLVLVPHGAGAPA
jgi:catechol 2,3-dioxygenase-like lactoylglutathione lyase family enzyme